MTLYRLTRVLLPVGLAAMAMSGCGPSKANVGIEGERTLIEASKSEPPKWVVREPKSDKEFHYFRGFRSDAPSLEGGETDARHNAMASIVQFLGLRVTVDYQRLRSEDKTAIADAIRSIGGADIFGTRLNEMYYRRWRVRGAGSFKEAYDVYVLIRFPKEAIARIKTNQQARLKSISELLVGPGRMGGPEAVYGQLTNTAQALSALDKLDESILVTTETVGQADAMRRQAQRRMAGILGSLQLSVSTNRPTVSSGSQSTPFIVTAQVKMDDIGGSQGVPRIPLVITLAGDESKAKTVWTDATGTASWEINDVTVAEGTVPVAAKVDLPAAALKGGDLAKSVPTATGVFKVVPVTTMTKLLVVVREESDGIARSSHDAEARLLKALKERGFTVVAPGQIAADRLAEDPWSGTEAARNAAKAVGANVVVTGTFTTSKPIPVEMMPGIHYCTARVNLVVTDVASGKVIASVVLPDETVIDTKGFGPSAEKAAEKALLLNRSRKRQPNGYDHIAALIVKAVSK